jgi:hypothetical protein
MYVFRHEYLAESEELETWIQEQMAAASSDDYGQDYEHLLVRLIINILDTSTLVSSPK